MEGELGEKREEDEGREWEGEGMEKKGGARE